MRMDRFRIKWSVGAVAALLVFLAASRWAYFPGDAPAARLVQSFAGENLDWARFITNTARAPWNYALLAIAAALSWRLAGWRGAAAAILCFAGMWLAGPSLQSLVGRPRPSSALIRVAGSSAGFSFPSIFGLTYGATFGFVALVAWQQRTSRFRAMILALCGLLLLIGGSARVALGAHWPSDVLGAYLLAIVWAAALVRFLVGRDDILSHPAERR